MTKLLFAALLLFGMLFSVSQCANADANSASLTVLPDNPALLYVGRWDKTDPTNYHSYWGGAYLRVSFTGTSAAIKVGNNTNLIVSIDEQIPRGISAQPGITQLNEKPLAPGAHTLLVGSSGQNYEVVLQGLLFDANSIVTAPATKPIIEFIGDSITTFGGPDDTTIANYAWNTAEALGCDHTQISFSGKALTTGYGCLPDKTGLDVQYFRLKNFNHPETTAWDMSTYIPTVVVINLGQNDQCGKEPNQVLTASLKGFVQKIRATYPLAQIVVLRPFSNAYGAVEQNAIRDLMFDGDGKLLFVDTTGWLMPGDFKDGVHPNGVGNLKVFSRLAPILRSLLPRS